MNKIKRFCILVVGAVVWVLTGFGKAKIYWKAAEVLNKKYFELY
jgi:hypothetical protein